jgi:ring-1,2-phenylacetyl-CoA epoxidase subunit PaaE
LLDTTTSVLTGRGIAEDRIHRELFVAGSGRAARPAPRPVAATQEPIAEALVTLHGRTSTVPLFEGDTLLEATQRHRPDVPYSCRAGVCSTCAASLIDGQVEQKVCHGLDPEEQAKGYVLTCQAFPRSDRVVATYDI